MNAEGYTRAVNQFAMTIRDDLKRETFFDHFERTVRELYPNAHAQNEVFYLLLRATGGKVAARTWMNKFQNKADLVVALRKVRA